MCVCHGGLARGTEKCVRPIVIEAGVVPVLIELYIYIRPLQLECGLMVLFVDFTMHIIMVTIIAYNLLSSLPVQAC